MVEFVRRSITAIVLVGLFSFIYFLSNPIWLSILFGLLLLTILGTEWPRFLCKSHPAWWLMTPFYPIAPFICLILLNQFHRPLILPLFLTVALFDTGSYLIGSIFGKHRIAPQISPLKSWEGAIGGYLLATIGLIAVSYYRQGMLPSAIVSASISLIICILALLGDLFESWLKRKAEIKDSGNLLAGHGGLLDRFDGIMFAALFFYCCAQWLHDFF